MSHLSIFYVKNKLHIRHLKKIGFLLLIIPLLSFTILHKFYLSVTQVDYSEKDRAFQMTSRIFIDDLERLIEERYGVPPKLATPNEHKSADFYIEKYLASKMVMKINGQQVKLNYLGKEYDNDVIKCYVEVNNISLDTIQEVTITNSILFELFEEQQNIIHFKINSLRKSFILIKGNDKGVLNL
ncbi:DUF6702 family protein [Leptobacterium sp. I13]|uniref:DUF6702 family protein n=1 Tax=Leptobacterium meishanense TaxID=3128904 RepID=UPI0030EE3523